MTPDAAALSQVGLSAGDVASLLRLRLLLDGAIEAAADRTELGRHRVLIAIDGACEFAAHLCAQRHGLAIKSDRFDAVVAALDAIPGWRREGVRNVRTLHRVRNLAQHTVTLPDEQHADELVTDGEIFIRRLVHAAFDVELESVRWADAILDDALRRAFAGAEAALAASSFAEAIQLGVGALADARQRWRAQQEDAYGYVGGALVLDGPPDWIIDTARAEDYADVGVFSRDLGSYHALLATRRQIAAGYTPTIEDAQLVLRFSFAWIMNWQRFAAAYPDPRWRAYWDSQDPPVDAPGAPPRVWHARARGAQQVGDRLLNRIDVVVANIPERGRGDWGDDLGALLPRLLEAQGRSRNELVPGQVDRLAGEFTFWAIPELDGESIVTTLTNAVGAATACYTRRRRDGAERTALAQAAAQAAARELAAVAPWLYGSAHGNYEMRAEGEVIAVTVSLHASASEANEVVGVWRSRGGQLADTALHASSAVGFTAFDLDADGREVLREAASAAAEQIERVRRHAEDTETRRRGLQAQLDRGLRTDNGEAL